MKVKHGAAFYEAQKIKRFIFDEKTSTNWVILEDNTQVLRPLTHGYVPEIGDYRIVNDKGEAFIVGQRMLTYTYDIVSEPPIAATNKPTTSTALMVIPKEPKSQSMEARIVVQSMRRKDL